MIMEILISIAEEKSIEEEEVKLVNHPIMETSSTLHDCTFLNNLIVGIRLLLPKLELKLTLTSMSTPFPFCYHPSHPSPNGNKIKHKIHQRNKISTTCLADFKHQQQGLNAGGHLITPRQGLVFKIF